MKVHAEAPVPYRLAGRCKMCIRDRRDTLNFGDAVIRKLCTFKDVSIKGELYSREFNQHFRACLLYTSTTDDIVEVNGDKWIISKRHKTKIPFQVKLLDIPLQIIKRYEPFQTRCV